MKRFWQAVEITDDFCIQLDGKPVRTPLKAPLRLPNMALAQAVAQEWQDAPAEFDPRTMLMTKLANTALDRITPDRTIVIAELAKWADADAICYRALEPEELVERQSLAWDPILAWALDTLQVSLIVVPGLSHKKQPHMSVARLVAVWEPLGVFALAGLHTLAAISASAVIATALVKQFLSPEEAWAAASLDEQWQLDFWGQDAEAVLRLGHQCLEFAAAARFLELSAPHTP